MLHRSPIALLAVAAAAALLLLAGLLQPATACTSLIVGRAATTDGSIYIARSDDGDDTHSTVNNLVYHPPRDVPAVFRGNLNNLTVVLPTPGLAFFALPDLLADPAAGRNASGESGGFNSAGVALSATESIYHNQAVLAVDPHVPNGIIEDAIPSLLLPQATSARQGAALLGSLVEQLGAGEAFGVLFADAREAWYLETASGHHWVAQRVPDHAFFVSANQGRFQEVDLSDSANVMHSPGLQQFAVANGLAKQHEHGKPLNFFKAFMRDGPHDEFYSYPRVCRLQQLLGGERFGGCHSAGRPDFLRPTHPLSWRELAAGMRDYFQGTHHDPYTKPNPNEPYRPILLLRTGNGQIFRLRPAGVPDGLSVVAYVAPGTQALSVFIPIYKGLPGDALPPELTTATPSPDPDSLFWRGRRLQALVFQDFGRLAPHAMHAIRAFEAHIEEVHVPDMEARYTVAITRGDEAGAAALLVQFTQDVVRLASELLAELAADAARALKYQGMPSDAELVEMLEEAGEKYAFEPWHDPYNSLGEVLRSVVGSSGVQQAGSVAEA